MAMMVPTAEILALFTGNAYFDFQTEWLAIQQFKLQQAINDFHDRAADGSEGPFGPIPHKEDSQFNAFLIYTLSVTKGYKQIFGLLQYMLNHVRSSVIGTQSTPIQGPPIVELKWGLMYDFVPCIITDYKIQPMEEAGYDPKSLFSQRLKISLSMEEMRNVHGNLWGDPSITGALPGWDTILDLNQSGRIGDARLSRVGTDYRSYGEDVSTRNRIVGPPPAFENHLSQN